MKLLIGSLIFVGISLCPEPVYVFCIDSLVGRSEQVGFTDFGGFIKDAVVEHPWMVWYATWNFNSLYKEGKELSASTSGLTNIITPLIERVSKDKNCDLSKYIPHIVALSVKPMPLHEMIKQIAAMKETTSHIFGVTLQDVYEHQEYSKKMKDVHGIDLNTIFSERITVPVATQLTTDDYVVSSKEDPSIVSVTHQIKGSFDEAYFKKLKQFIIKKINNEDVNIVYVDTNQKHIDMAQKVGLKAINIDKPERNGELVSFHKATIEEMLIVVEKFKQKLKESY